MRTGLQKFKNLLDESQKKLEILPKIIKELDTLESEFEPEDQNEIQSEEGATKMIKELLERIENQISESTKKVDNLKISSNDYNSQSQISLYNNLVKDLSNLNEKIKKTLNVKSAQTFVYDAYIGYENLLLNFQKNLENSPSQNLINKQRWINIRRIYTSIISNRLSRWQVRKNLFFSKEKEPIQESPSLIPTSPLKFLPPNQKSDNIDSELSKVLEEIGVDIPIKKLGPGQYLVGNKKLNIKILTGFLVVRIGGGYMRFKEFIEKHSKSLGIVINPNPVGKVGTAVLSGHGKMNLFEKKN